MEFKFIHENVWMAVTDCDDIFNALTKPYLKLDYTKYPGNKRDWVINHFNDVAEVVVDKFLSGGVMGAELANLYATHVLPSTAKKLSAARRMLF